MQKLIFSKNKRRFVNCKESNSDFLFIDFTLLFVLLRRFASTILSINFVFTRLNNSICKSLIFNLFFVVRF